MQSALENKEPSRYAYLLHFPGEIKMHSSILVKNDKGLTEAYWSFPYGNNIEQYEKDCKSCGNPIKIYLGRIKNFKQKKHK
ncbi:MAG: hypothetical protein QM752_08365 [Gammaproteobacteria bacterium]